MKARIKERKRLRLKEYDCSQPGAYFVTICTKDRVHRFGEIVDGEMRGNDLAAVVQSCWMDLPNHYPNIESDEFVVMPNHVHGIIIILDYPVGAMYASPLQRRNNTLGDVVGSFKSAVTKRINEITHTPGMAVWQRGYNDHIIRNERSLTRIREYIANNPQHWASDKQNRESEGNDGFERWLSSRGKQPVQEITQ